jgi:hypothetical protein
MIRRLALVAVCIAALPVALSACGGSDRTDATAGTPVLRNTPIPTVAVEPTATPVCDPPAASAMPANFPSDVPVPPGYKVDAVETAPHLKVAGRVVPPPVGKIPYGVVSDALTDNLTTRGWRLDRVPEGDGITMRFTNSDGRSGTYHVLPVVGCTAEVSLTYELEWVTP